MILKPHPYPGLFIDIEGLDGSGATTQATFLTQKFRDQKIEAFQTKEPTNNVIGGLIRGALTGVYKIPPPALQLLFVADRLHHLDREIIPILQNHSVVVTDRFLWSTIAFGSVETKNKRWLLELHRYCPLPDLTVFLRVPPKECVRRMKQDRFDFELFEEEHKLWKAWDTYEWLAKKFPDHIHVINGEPSPTLVFDSLWPLIQNHPKYQFLISGQK